MMNSLSAERKRLFYGCATVMWMVAIFIGSSVSGLASGLPEYLDWPFRKMGHMAEFGTLYWLWFKTLGVHSTRTSIGIAAVYALSDEVHQAFTDGRVPSIIDVCIDSVGILCAWYMTHPSTASKGVYGARKT